MMRNAVETVETCLAHAKALAREETLLALDFPKGEHLLNYGHAANCLDAFLSASTATDENDSLIREFCLTHEELRDYRGLVLIVGPPGYGKTSYCRWSALEDLKVWRSQHDRCHLPIYIRLNTLDVIALSSEQELFAAGLQSGLLHEEDWRLVMTGEVPVRLYLDGLDEVSSEDGRKMIVALSRRLASAKPDWQLILTSRDYMRAEWLQGIARIELLGFSNFEVQQLATAMLQGCEHLSTQFLAQLAATKYLSDLSRVPLLATLMILVFRKNGDLPGKRASLYSTFIELLCGGWDFVKGVQRGITFGRDVKIAILTRAAWVAHESHARFFDLEQFSDVCIVAAPGVFAACSRDDRTRKIVDLIDELLIDGLLRRSGQLMQFAHMSFQEFLAAKELAQGSLKNRIDSILTQYLYGDDWWREVLLFVIGLASDPESVADWIHQQFTDAGVEGHQARVREKQLLGELEKLFPGIVATR
jgi:predicted NACHT family NTPase